jgi:hypothetical protein
MIRLTRAAAGWSLAVIVLMGCSNDKKPAELTQDEEAIKNVGLAYRDASSALRRGPANVNELKPYLKKYGDPDKLLVSANDGQPYEIVWRMMPLRPSKEAFSKPFLAYEKTGKDGKRYAVDIMMKVHHLDDAEFTQMKGSN